MLEILEVLTASHIPVKKNLIFLFNDGEENGLRGSTLFMTEHSWAQEMVAFINLEARGSGGRQLLFQASSNQPWLINSYSKAVLNYDLVSP